ncbi:putative L-carnitine dehydratase [Streptomyces lasiicapitis]|uniref:L-carnitine dehydratase n=1 Tax=Streptomyces lasiicapitis TaxID=1923961 RepID=A0ABQ2MD64_9ACTN|nr:putative L-carnitine dehydratase [Streptomyces lasiicapitis]
MNGSSPLSGAEVAWAALGGDPALLSRLSPVVREDTLPARLPVRALARSCVGVCALAAAELAALRTGRDVPHARVDDGSVAAAFTSERQLLVDGRAPVTFAPLSRFWRTADGWVRTHANYPHHRARLLAALGLGDGEASEDDAAVKSVGARLAELSAFEVEESVYAAGGLAVALRTPDEWAAHPQGVAVAGLPLVGRERLDVGGPGEVAPLPPLPGGTDPLLPAAGLRVLDLTRVIAGPVATRTLALLGADVLRVDPPHLPELPDQHADTGFGKRSAALDLRDRADRRAFEDLLAGADVVVTGYRPGTLDRFGLAPDALAERRPGLVVAQLSAWGTSGPWSDRRGFDSLVQVASGIAVAEGSPESPGALPAQALDHGTGYLLAAAVLRALSERAAGGAGTGGTVLVRLALARTAAWLTGWPTYSAEPWLTGMDGGRGRLRYARPPVAFADGPVNWENPPGSWGGDAPVWR